MRCIFCKQSSASSKSVEHIIPQSLGNNKYVLPKGIVCDACNNYFSRKVEKPFMDLPVVRRLRFEQDLESKRGNIPSLDGLILPDVPALITRHLKQDFTSVQVSEPDFLRIRRADELTMVIPLATDIPATPVVSRFLAKVALEALALRLVKFPDGIAYIRDETQLDALRDHARRGYGGPWPIHVRTIHHQNARIVGPDGRSEQIVHEFDILVTDQSEWFLVMAIFGVEFSINLGGPEISGYRRWLEQSGGVSPLYAEKYGGPDAMPR